MKRLYFFSLHVESLLVEIPYLDTPYQVRGRLIGPGMTGVGNDGDYLQGLKESGIGAIYTPAVEISFALKDGDNTTRGQIKQTGVYISENGQAGTVQQIDVAV